MGGMIAQTAAIEHPERLLTLTSLMSTPGGLANSLARPRAIRALLAPAPRTRAEAMERSVDFFRTVGGSRPGLPEAAVRELAGRCWDRGRNPRGFLRQLAAIAASGDRRPALAEVTVPTLVLHGDEDPLIPARAGRATARAIPDATLRIIDGMGHNLPPDAWEELHDAIEEHARRHQP